MPNTGDYVRARDFDELKPQLSIGTVTTGAAGTNASASVTGTTPNFKLNLTIPRGNAGATGPAGPSGTFTGPLKPTSSYWRTAVYTVTGTTVTWKPPAGGTWAWHCDPSSFANVDIASCGVTAGGTALGSRAYPATENATYYGPLYASRLWCWRIQ